VPGLRVVTFAAGTGYGAAGEGYVDALASLGVPLTWTPMAPGAGSWGPAFGIAPLATPDPALGHLELQLRSLDHDRVLVHVPREWQARWREEERDRPIALFTAWEADRAPASWVPTLDRFERLLVPSRHAAAALRAAGVAPPIDIVPHVATAAAAPPRPENAPFVFLTVGTWTSRKALDQTILAYLDAFTADDAVELVVKTEPVDHIAATALGLPAGAPAPLAASAAHSLARLLAGRRNPPRVRLVTRTLDPASMRRLLAEADGYVSLTRGEGWGLPAFDAACAGLPVVTTGWGGSLDFLGEDHPWLVPCSLEPTTATPPDGHFPAEPGMRWAHADRAAAAALLREVYENRHAAAREAAARGARLRVAFAPERVGRTLLTALEALRPLDPLLFGAR
jgi:glycosyltransferase involved in cell wall biosynthesis